MAITNFLPLGSVVLLENGNHPIMVVARALQVKKDDQIYFFDYAGVAYPEGLTGEQLYYFNNDWIKQISFIGFNDEFNREAQVDIQQYIERLGEIKRYPKPGSEPQAPQNQDDDQNK